MSGALAIMLCGTGGIITVGSTFAADTDSTLTIDKPSGVVAGDLLLSIVGSASGVTWTGDSGWTEIGDYGSAPGLRLARKIATGAEASNYTFASSLAAIQDGIIIALRNAVFDVAGSFGNATGGADLTMPSVTMSGDGLLLACCVGDTTARTFSSPSGMDAAAPVGSLSTFSQFRGAGATGTKTTTPSGGKTTGVLIGIKGA